VVEAAGIDLRPSLQGRDDVGCSEKDRYPPRHPLSAASARTPSIDRPFGGLFAAPLLVPNIAAHYGVYLYYGSRTAQPKRVRAFIDLAMTRLHEAPAVVLGRNELEAATHSWRRSRRSTSHLKSAGIKPD
jgi:hypothetical protein